MQTQTWDVSCKRSVWRRTLAVFLGAVIVAVGFAIAAELKDQGVRGKTAGLPIMLSFFLAFAVGAALFIPGRGTLSLDAQAVSLRVGSLLRTLPLLGATQSYGKWTQQYVGVKGSILYLATSDGALSIGGEGFVFQHPAWYRQGVSVTCDAWLSKDAFGAFHEALGRAEERLAPPPPPSPEPVDHGYREPGYVPQEPAPPRPIPSWVEVELERNPAASSAQNYYFIRSLGIVLSFLFLYGLGMGLMFAVHEHQLTQESALGIGIFVAICGLAVLVLLALRKTYGTQLRIEQGVLRMVQGPKILASAMLRDVRIEHAVYSMQSRQGIYRVPTLLLHFPGGKTMSLGSHGVDLAAGSPRPSGPPEYLVGFAEWEPLAQALRRP